MTHIPLCQTKGCPHPSDPDWHRCFINGCNKQEGDHQHFPKKSLAGKGAKIVAFLCRNHHQKITLYQWREGVYPHPDGSTRYYVQNQKGEQQCERIIEAAPLTEAEAPALARVWDNESDEEAFATKPEIIDNPEDAAAYEHTPTLPAVTEEAIVQYDPTCLRLPENMPYEKWAELGGTLQMMGKGLPWWAGRWVNFGEAKFGEKYSQAVEETGLSRGLLANYAWVESKVDPSLRNENLSWSHHRMVADLEPKEQREWLQWAHQHSQPANALRAAIKGEEPDTCPESATGRHEYACIHCKKAR